MKGSKVLLADSIINLILGFFLAIFPLKLVRLLGVLNVENTFYPNILGGVFISIGIALLIEYFQSPKGLVGLGIGGAIAINLCGGLVLAFWLISAKLNIPLRGQVVLWTLAIILFAISGAELFLHLRRKDKSMP